MSKAFDPDVLGDIVQKCVGLPYDQMLDAISEEAGQPICQAAHPQEKKVGLQ